MIKIDKTEILSNTLRITMSGVYGIGSKGNPSHIMLSDHIKKELSNNKSIEYVEMDYSSVDYEWGDGPVATIIDIMGFAEDRVKQAIIISGQNNHKALKNVVNVSGLGPIIKCVVKGSV